jgi:hypothetical protein
MHGSEMHVVARLCARAELSIRDEDLLSPLYSPELIAIASNALLLRGFQSEDEAAYVQEWRLLSRRIRPPRVGYEGLALRR